ncbi:MAG TPA: YggT family protein [Fibrobacteria bacterium]|jgi:hypothetical protein|nr:YggT family protein [Fibrobacteria bacterium]
MNDEKLAADEERRERQHEQVKARVEGEVHREIAEQAMIPEADDFEDVGKAAGELRRKSVHEVVATDREIGRGRAAARVSQVIDYLFFLVYALLCIRILLGVMAANPASGFVQFVYNVTGFLYAPFYGIVGNADFGGGHVLEMSLVVALVVYIVLHAALNGILRMVAHRKTQV